MQAAIQVAMEFATMVMFDLKFWSGAMLLLFHSAIRHHAVAKDLATALDRAAQSESAYVNCIKERIQSAQNASQCDQGTIAAARTISRRSGVEIIFREKPARG